MIRVEHEVEMGSGKFFLVAKAVQADGPGFKKMVIPFLLEYPENSREVRLLFQDKPVTESLIEISGKPSKILVDPAQNNLAIYR